MFRKTMLTLVCGVTLLVSTVALRVSLSNDGRLNDLRSPATEEFDAPAADSDDPFDQIAEAPAPEKGPGSRQSASLRQRFVELTAKRAQRMSDDELGQAVEEITKILADQDTEAQDELEKAEEQLKSVVEKFPGTPSAERANRALGAMKVKPGPAINSDLDEEEVGSAPGRRPAQPIMPAKSAKKPPRR
jgi:hypothetical protein